MDIEHGIARPQTSDHSPGIMPTWSYDGTLAYISNRSLRIDGRTTQIVQTPPNILQPMWSPDGTQIAFLASGDDDIFNIHLWHRFTGSITQLTYGEFNIRYFEWSPDGTHLAFIEHNSLYRPDNFDPVPTRIHVLDTISGEIVTMRGIRPVNSPPTWSPDSTRLAFLVNLNPRTGIVIWDSRDDTLQLFIPRLVNGVSQIDWSPDGEWLAFTSLNVDNLDIFIMNLDSEEVRHLTYIATDDTMPQWSPDGTYIGFVSLHFDGGDIYILEVATGFIRNVTNRIGTDTHLAWRP